MRKQLVYKSEFDVQRIRSDVETHLLLTAIQHCTFASASFHFTNRKCLSLNAAAKGTETSFSIACNM